MGSGLRQANPQQRVSAPQGPHSRELEPVPKAQRETSFQMKRATIRNIYKAYSAQLFLGKGDRVGRGINTRTMSTISHGKSEEDTINIYPCCPKTFAVIVERPKSGCSSEKTMSGRRQRELPWLKPIDKSRCGNQSHTVHSFSTAVALNHAAIWKDARIPHFINSLSA